MVAGLIKRLILKLRYRREKPSYSSATVEPHYKPKFNYVNFYKLYLQGKKAAQNAKGQKIQD